MQRAGLLSQVSCETGPREPKVFLCLQATAVVLEQRSACADLSVGSLPGLCNCSGPLLPAGHHAHDSHDGPHSPCSLQTLYKQSLAAHAGVFHFQP